MNYNYTAYFKTDKERYEAIANDILREYPNLGELAFIAAQMEQPFGRVNEDYMDFSEYENHINRLIDIIIVTEGKAEYQNEYNKACKDLMKNYDSWLHNFGYANPKEQSASIVVQAFMNHLEDPTVRLLTINDADEKIKSKGYSR